MEQPGKPVRTRHPTIKFIICEAGKPVANRQENSLFVEQAEKPVAKPQENSLFVEEAGKPVAEARGDTHKKIHSGC